MSDRRAEILRQQRLVAQRLSSAAATPTNRTTAASDRTTRRGLTDADASTRTSSAMPRTSKQASLAQKSTQRKQLKSILNPSSSEPEVIDLVSPEKQQKKKPPPQSSQQQKRPTKRGRSHKKPLPPPMTASAAIAASKNRVATAAAISKQPHCYGDGERQQTTGASARKSLNLAQLVSTSSSTPTTTTDDHSSASYSYYGQQVEPGDFWKHMRDWNALSQLAQTAANTTMTTTSAPATTTTTETTTSRKALPETFVSNGHYVAAWAPLCLAEARAQLLSDLSLRNLQFHPVTAKSVAKDGSSMLDCMRVQVYRKEKTANEAFMPNDLVVLIPDESKELVQRALLPNATSTMSEVPSLRKHGLVGHVEYRRDSMDGLLLLVSKKWWATLGQKDMWLVKLGGNVTAVREFTALCRVESCALSRYILGQHLLVANTTSKSSAATATAATDATLQTSATTSKYAMLHAMGGSDALGKGFIKYVQKKFNPSQLAAISAAAEEYGDGGFTLCKGPPGTGKTSTLVAILNSLHIRQFNKYYEEVRRVAAMTTGSQKVRLGNAVKCKPRLLVCAPSNAAVDNVILKIMQDGFVDGSGQRYNPSIIRVGVGMSDAVRDVALEKQVNSIVIENSDVGRLETTIAGYKMELQRIQTDLVRLRRRVHAIAKASPWPLSKDWEIRIEEDTFEETGRVYFVNHKDKTTSFEVPPPPEPGEKQFAATAMPEYRSYMSRIVKLVETFNSITTKLERCNIIKNGLKSRGNDSIAIRQQLETHILDTVHIVCTTLGTAGNRVVESAAKFEVVVIDEAAQSTEPATLAALQLGSRHAVLVGDPQQLPATIFNVSGRNSKYDRSLFQRLEEAGQKVYMLNLQYRMHPLISDFPRRIFYDGNLLDGPNVQNEDYGNPLRRVICSRLHSIKPFTLFDLDSKETRDGTSLANHDEARLAVHLFLELRQVTNGLSAKTRVAVITPYAQQANLLRRVFGEALGPDYERLVEVNTVDGFQGREANIVIFSCVRAAGSHGVGFLSDVRRMNVALTRAKFFLFVIARCESIVVNPYWRDLVDHARDTHAVISVPMANSRGQDNSTSPAGFPDLVHFQLADGRQGKRKRKDNHAQRKPPGRLKESH